MMKKLSVLLITLALACAPAVHAGDNPIRVEVNGLVCDFCARALEKVFDKQPAVAEIDVDLGKKVILIHLKDGAEIDDALVSKLVTDAGYGVVEIIRHATDE